MSNKEIQKEVQSALRNALAAYNKKFTDIAERLDSIEYSIAKLQSRGEDPKQSNKDKQLQVVAVKNEVAVAMQSVIEKTIAPEINAIKREIGFMNREADGQSMITEYRRRVFAQTNGGDTKRIDNGPAKNRQQLHERMFAFTDED